MSIDPVAFSTAYAPGAYAFSGSPSYASTSAGGFSYSPPLPGPAAQQAGMGWTANLGGNAGGQDSPEEGASEDEDGLAPLPGETNGRVKGKKADREIKRRSSKACDNCRKSKCKCNRAPLPDGTIPTTGPCQNCAINGVECTFNGASRKRGPPKGYIEAIESRLHRMEALLGNLLQSDDPRAQALLGELIGDNEAKEMLKNDLKAATEGFEGGKGRKSWKLPPLPDVEGRLGKLGTTTGDFSTMRGDLGNVSDDDKPDVADEVDQLHLVNSTDAERQRNQRRRLNSDAATTSSEVAVNPLIRPPAVGRSNTIPHTGTATYTLAGSAIPMSPPADTSSGSAQPISELADVVGQLSLDENEQVRYHGRSSGLYLISKSQRYRDFFWHFPKTGVWPPAESRKPKTEAEILESTQAAAALPDRATMDHLLDVYWAYCHPVIPVLYKVEFLRAYRAMLAAPDIPASLLSADGAAGGGKISMLLLLVMFSLAARYTDRESKPAPGEYCSAGDRYMHMAKKILNQECVSSKLPTCQALLLLAYREIGIGCMAESFLYTGMAVRMAQDMGLFRDVDKWFMPVTKFSYDVKQTRKRVWWACVILDKYVSTYIGRPMAIFERDYDTAFPSPDEPDEHEQWLPLRPDGTDLAREPSIQVATPTSDGGVWDPNVPRPAYPQHKTHAISCFNCSASLSVLISRIVANIYAIRIRVIGQSSETLLSLLDQNLANWYLELPEPLRYSPSATTKNVPPPHVLTLHAQFYTALILLHRPFIPGQGAPREGSAFPSHSICTTAANAIATISSVHSRTFGLRQAAPFMVYYTFTAAILHVYNTTFEAGMAVTARRNLLKCMNGLEEMEGIWPGARRARELLIGLVDLRDVDLSDTSAASPAGEDRGIKRPSEFVASPASMEITKQLAARSDFHHLPHFHTRGGARRGGPTSRGADRAGSGSNRRNRSASTSKIRPGSGSQAQAASASPELGSGLGFPPGMGSRLQQTSASTAVTATPAGFEAFFQSRPGTATSSTYDIFGLTPPANAQSLPLPGEATAATSSSAPTGPTFADMMASFLASSGTGQTPPGLDVPSPNGTGRGTGLSPLGAFDFSVAAIGGGTDMATGYDSSAFFGMPLSADVQAEDWQHYLPSAFFSGGGGGPSPGNGDNGSSPGSVFGTTAAGTTTSSGPT